MRDALRQVILMAFRTYPMDRVTETLESKSPGTAKSFAGGTPEILNLPTRSNRPDPTVHGPVKVPICGLLRASPELRTQEIHCSCIQGGSGITNADSCARKSPPPPQKLSKTLSPRGGTCRGLQELEIDCMRSDARQKQLARLRNQVDRIKDELRLKEESK